MNDPANAIEVDELVREFRKGPARSTASTSPCGPARSTASSGPNGAGKSTTVLMLTTLLPPTSGRARVGGFDIVRQGAQVRASIGAALQEAALDAILTGREHLILQATLQGIPGRAAQGSAPQELLERVGLTEAADRRVGGYSGGMKRRLDLALALVHEPRILFLDEPTTGLDPQSRAALWEEVARLAHDEGMTVFLTTQYLEEADVLADRIGIIDQRQDRRRGHARTAEGRDRQPERRGHAGRPGAGERLAELLSRLRRAQPRRTRQRHRAAARAARRSSPRSSGCSTATTCGRDAPAPPALARRRVPGQDRPQARGSRLSANARTVAARTGHAPSRGARPRARSASARCWSSRCCFR